MAFEQTNDYARAINGKGGRAFLSLPNGGYVSAFTADIFSGDNSGSVDLAIIQQTAARASDVLAAPIVLHVDDVANAVDCNNRVVSDELPADEYSLRLTGEGLRQGGRSPLEYWIFILAFDSQGKGYVRAINGKFKRARLILPVGGFVSAFTADIFSGDNSGSVDLKITPFVP